MASDKKLTRYTSAVTIVTADVMNSLYGGEYGYNDSVDGFHPLVFGHVHDGTHEDGHASKILLTNGAHVRGYLANANLGGTDGTTPAVRYSNIMCYSDATYGSPAARRAAAAAGGYDLEILAIPEYIEDPTTGEKCYYLDLSNSAGGINGSIQYNENGSFSGNNDLFYDYTNLRFGAGINTPQRKVHIVDNAHPPLRIEGITAGTGSVLVVDGSGDIYSDASIGNQNLFESIALSASGGTVAGSSPIEADSTTDTLNLSAGANITLTGDPGTDTITISATTSSQDAYKFIDLTGNTSGDTDIDATIADDTLTLTGGTGIRLSGSTAGQSIEIDNTQQAFRTITGNQTGTGTSSGADVIADQINDTLTIEAGNNIDVTLDSGNDKVTISANVPAAENQFYSQWAGAAQWAPVRGIGVAYPKEPKYIQLIKFSGGAGGTPIVSDRNIWVLCKTDYTVGSTGIADGGQDGGLGPTAYVSGPPEDHNSSAPNGSYFDLLVPIPVNGNLSKVPGASTDGSNQGGLPAYQDAVPSISVDAPTSCRVTAYFILDEGGTQNSSARLNINIAYNGLGAPNLDFAHDGTYMHDDDWIYSASSPTQTLQNQHNYPSGVSDGMMVVSDFSPLKISVANQKDGMASFRLRVTFPSGYDPVNGTYFSGLEGQEALYNCFKFLGARLLWIWE